MRYRTIATCLQSAYQNRTTTILGRIPVGTGTIRYIPYPRNLSQVGKQKQPPGHVSRLYYAPPRPYPGLMSPLAPSASLGPGAPLAASPPSRSWRGASPTRQMGRGGRRTAPGGRGLLDARQGPG